MKYVHEEMIGSIWVYMCIHKSIYIVMGLNALYYIIMVLKDLSTGVMRYLDGMSDIGGILVRVDLPVSVS